MAMALHVHIKENKLKANILVIVLKVPKKFLKVSVQKNKFFLQHFLDLFFTHFSHLNVSDY